MKKTQETLVLVNPMAGRGRARHVQEQVVAYLREQGHVFHFSIPQSISELEQRAAGAASAGYAAVVALGGDGTFQQVVKATLGTGVVLGLLPAGGGNDVAAALGIPNDPVAAAHAFLHSPPRPVDVLRARFSNGESCIYVGGGGLGLDAEAARLANGRFRRFPGAARYVAAALAALATFQPFRVEVELDGQPIPARGPLMFAAVANSPTYGAGVQIAPEAKIDDGLLDVALVDELSWTRLIELIPVILRKGEARFPEIHRYRGRRVVLRAERAAAFHGDGEVLGEAPVEVENLPGAIRVAAPGANGHT